MADDKGSAPTSGSAPDSQQLPDLPAFPGREEDFLFKAQMTIANLFYGYWKHALGTLVAVLVAVFLWGTWQNKVRDDQRATHAEIAKITRILRAGLTEHADNPEMVKAQAAEGARRLVALAQEADGAGATYALIRAAQAWRVAEDQAQVLATWELAHAHGAKGELGWAAVSGLAGARFDAGNVDGAVQVLTSWAGQRDSYDAQRALFEAARYQELDGRTEQAISAFEGFAARFPESPLADQATAAVGRLRSNG